LRGPHGHAGIIGSPGQRHPVLKVRAQHGEPRHGLLAQRRF